MYQGTLLDWVNLLVLWMTGIGMLVFGRILHYRCLAVYTLVFPAAAALVMVSFDFGDPAVFPVFAAVRGLEYLLLLGAVAEIMRRDYQASWRQLWWVFPAAGAIALYLAYPMLRVWSYYLPRMLLFYGIASTAQFWVGLRRHPQLLSLIVLAAGLGVSDVYKFLFVGADAYQKMDTIQAGIDPLIILFSRTILLVSLASPELAAVWRRLAPARESRVMDHFDRRMAPALGSPRYKQECIDQWAALDLLRAIPAARDEYLPWPEVARRGVSREALQLAVRAGRVKMEIADGETRYRWRDLRDLAGG